MKNSILFLITLSFLFLLTNCNSANGDKYLGKWKEISSIDVNITISKTGESFIVKSDYKFGGIYTLTKEGNLNSGMSTFILDNNKGDLIFSEGGGGEMTHFERIH